MMNSSNGAELEPETTKKVKSHDLKSEPAKDELHQLPVTPELGVDELCLIFVNYWISTDDLLSFRMVSKNWCDAATTILLKRDACFVELTLDVASNQFESRSHEQLSQLTDLISNSPKFPTTNFRIHTPSNLPADYAHFSDLMLLFQLHGDKILTLGPHGWITEKCLLDILFVYIPRLECIDLSEGKFISVYERSRRKFTRGCLKRNLKVCLPLNSLWVGQSWNDVHYPDLPEPEPEQDYRSHDNNDNDKNSDSDDNQSDSDVTEIVYDYNRSRMINLLLSVSSKLISIETVNLATLGGVLREGKAHLIQSYKYSYFNSFDHLATQIIEKFMATNPKLSTVTFDMNYENVSHAAVVNKFIDSFKDTVQDLTFRFFYDDHGWKTTVKIPPMKQLKSITVVGYDLAFAEILIFCDDNVAVSDLNLFFVELKNGISSENYFPSLIKASLKFEGRCAVEANPMNFFKFKSDENNLLCGSLPRVDILETDEDVIASLYAFQHANETPQTPLFSDKFPNVRILKIKCENLQNVASCYWGMSPKVKFMEIYGIQEFTSNQNENAVELSHLVDKFFTGFTLEMCKKLKKTKFPPKRIHDPDRLKFLRVAPSICDLAHLRELKLQFVAPFSTEFASSVTGLYAFLKMPNAKFIISYGSNIFRGIKGQTGISQMETVADAEAAEELCFGSIKPYVQIVHE